MLMQIIGSFWLDIDCIESIFECYEDIGKYYVRMKNGASPYTINVDEYSALIGVITRNAGSNND